MSKIVNHYGKYVNVDQPITGVINGNGIAWDCVNDDECLTCEEAYKAIEENDGWNDYQKQEAYDEIECDPCHTKIFGDWILDTNTGEHSPDPNGEFAAIENEDYVQVVFSKFTKRCNLCSPCYPGQGDLDSTGEFLTYALPPYLTGE